MEKKKLTLKEIGVPRLLLILGAGVLLLVLSLPGERNTDGEGAGWRSGSAGQSSSAGQNSGNGVLSGGVGLSGSGTGNTFSGVGSGAGTDWYTAAETGAAALALEERLETLLRKVSGIGDVKVMITLKSSAETVVLKDSPYTSGNTAESDGAGGERKVTELEQGEETILTEEGYPYVIKRIEPEVEGIVILAQGASDAAIVSEITEAVQVLFGVPAHKVKVMKMEH